MAKKKKKPKSKLTAAEIEKFKDILLTKRQEILGDVNHMEDETLRKPRSDLSNVPIHMADAGTDNYEMEHTLGLMDGERKILVAIDGALGRIENATYGICEGDNKPIPKGRLNAIPWARYCVACAGLAEKGITNGFTEQQGDLDDVNYGDNEPKEGGDTDQ